MSSPISSSRTTEKSSVLLHFLLFFSSCRGNEHTSEFIGFSGVLLWIKASRHDGYRDVIIDRFTDLLTLATADTAFSRHDQVLCVKIHREGLCRALRRAGVTPLRRRAQPMRDRCEPHANLVSSRDRQQRLGGTSGDARRVVTEITRNLVRKNHRRCVLLMKDNRAVRAGLCAVTAFRAPFEKQRLINRARRTQPIGA